jgi:cytochrome subunit of sulfide dehydrogenase
MKHVYKFAAVLVAAGLAFAPSLRAGGSTSTSTLPYSSGALTLNHPGRVLASNCFQCHGTNGHGMGSLAGKSASDIAGDMKEMALKSPGEKMMFAHARGYSAAQIDLIADYFSKQQP